MRDPIEERLARMRPAPVPNAAMARLIAARPQPATPRPSRSRMIPAWFGWAVITCIIVALAGVSGPVFKVIKARTARAALARATTPVTQTSRVFLPVEQRNYLVRTDDLGIVDADSPNPVRLVRTIWVDDATFRGTDGISSARLTQPRERIIPVALEIY